VAIEVAAAGVNFPDLLMVRGLYQARPEPPFAPGLEVAGTVVAGDGFAAGDRVMAFVPHGGWAERVTAATTNTHPVPEAMPFEVAAVLPVAYGTAVHALVDRAMLAAGETLLVLGGGGGVGLAAVEVGVLLGARVVAVVGSEEKQVAAEAAGAEVALRRQAVDLRQTLTEVAPDGIDVVFDPVGGESTEAAFRSLGWGGRLLVVGFAAGSIPRLPANLALLKGASLVGVFWGRFAELRPDANAAHLRELVAWWEQGGLDPVISGRFGLADGAQVLGRLAAGDVVGKLVIVP
jgi:NADPH2:quinone reductase